MKKITLFLLLLLLQTALFAGEGMWLPIFLKQLNEADMQSKGMKVSAEDIYSVNKSSMKDAVVLFGSGCTGEIISDGAPTYESPLWFFSNSSSQFRRKKLSEKWFLG